VTAAEREGNQSSMQRKPQEFYDILNSKNKHFGDLLRSSESVSSDLSHAQKTIGNTATAHFFTERKLD
jgi:hypothetical protein